MSSGTLGFVLLDQRGQQRGERTEPGPQLGLDRGQLGGVPVEDGADLVDLAVVFALGDGQGLHGETHGALGLLDGRQVTVLGGPEAGLLADLLLQGGDALFEGAHRRMVPYPWRGQPQKKRPDRTGLVGCGFPLGPGARQDFVRHGR